MVSALKSPALPLGSQKTDPLKTGKPIVQDVPKERSALTKMLEKSRDEQYNVFMKMFLAQVKNQNPDNPMSTHEMTQSVMSFFSAAEQAQTNKLLKNSNDMKVKEQMAAAKSYLNKEIVYEGDVMKFEGDPEDIQLMMPTDVKEAELVILDANLMRVKTIPLSPETGTQRHTWDGTSDQNPKKKVDPGIYYTKVMGIDKKEQNLDIPTILKGTVRQVSYQEDEGEFLLLVKDDIGVEVDNLISVRKPASQELMDLSKNMQEQIKQYTELTKLLKGGSIPEAPQGSTSVPDYIS